MYGGIIIPINNSANEEYTTINLSFFLLLYVDFFLLTKYINIIVCHKNNISLGFNINSNTASPTSVINVDVASNEAEANES